MPRSESVSKGRISPPPPDTLPEMTTSADDHGLVEAAAQRDPYPAYARLRADAPIHFSPHWKGWLITRYADVATAFRHPGLSAKASSALTTPHPCWRASRRASGRNTPLASHRTPYIECRRAIQIRAGTANPNGSSKTGTTTKRQKTE